MPRALRKIVDGIFLILLLSVAISLVAQRWVGEMWGWVVVSGASMEPTLQRGDFVFVVPRSGLSGMAPGIGEVIAYRDESGSWTLHRVVGLDPGGYLTQGDRNAYVDQDAGQAPIPLHGVAGTALSVGGWTFRVPLVGSLFVILNTSRLPRPVLYLLMMVIAVVLIRDFLGERRGRRVRPRLRRRLRRDRPQGLGLGLTLLVVVMMVSVMLRWSKRVDFAYAVSVRDDDVRAVSGGVDLGVVRADGSHSRTVEWELRAPLRTALIFLPQSERLTFPQNPLSVMPQLGRRVVEVVVDTLGAGPGSYVVPVTVLLLPQWLPPTWLLALARIHVLVPMLTVAVMAAAPVGLLMVLGRRVESPLRRRAARLRRMREAGLI